MNALFEKVLSSEVLDDETKAQIKEGLEQFLSETREQISEELKAEYAAKFVEDKQKLVEALDTKLEVALSEEINELKNDISSYKDLEVEYAEKSVEAKKELATKVASDMAELVETLDSFLELRIASEVEELKEDLMEAKKLQFGKDLYEGFVKEFEKNFFRHEGIGDKLNEAQAKLTEVTKQLNETKKELNSSKRSQEMNRVLESLQGKPREIMEAILQSVPTEQLAEAYNKFIPRVLHESAVVEQKENPVKGEVLAEGTDLKEETKVVTGDKVDESKVDEVEKPRIDEGKKLSLKKLAGIE
jgi:hypothetical protein